MYTAYELTSERGSSELLCNKKERVCDQTHHLMDPPYQLISLSLSLFLRSEGPGPGLEDCPTCLHSLISGPWQPERCPVQAGQTMILHYSQIFECENPQISHFVRKLLHSHTQCKLVGPSCTTSLETFVDMNIHFARKLLSIQV